MISFLPVTVSKMLIPIMPTPEIGIRPLPSVEFNTPFKNASPLRRLQQQHLEAEL